MATEIVTVLQSTAEVRTHYVDFTADLPDGVTVTGGAAVHTPPSGAATTPTVGSPQAGDILPVTVGPLLTAGRHVVTVTATLSSGDTSVARLIIPVEWEPARAGMAEIVADLRGLTDAGSNDYTVGGLPYWTDRQLERVLDRHKTELHRRAILPRTDYEAGQAATRVYPVGLGNLEGGAALELEDAAGNTVGTALYSVDYAAGVVTFAANTSGALYYLNGRSFDVNAAAAEVWRMKAGHYAAAYDISADGQSLRRSQIIAHCQAMAAQYAGQASPTSVWIERWD